MKLINLFKSAILAAAVIVGLNAQSQNVQYFYSGMLVQTNFVDSTGSTNPVASNYPNTGAWLSTKGVVPSDVNANGYTLQLVSSQVLITTNGSAQVNSNINVTATFAPILDDWSVVNGAPACTNRQFNVTFIGSTSTNKFTDIVFVPATNTLGARQFKLVGLSYGGTNTLLVNSFRGGFWY